MDKLFSAANAVLHDLARAQRRRWSGHIGTPCEAGRQPPRHPTRQGPGTTGPAHLPDLLLLQRLADLARVRDRRRGEVQGMLMHHDSASEGGWAQKVD